MIKLDVIDINELLTHPKNFIFPKKKHMEGNGSLFPLNAAHDTRDGMSQRISNPLSARVFLTHDLPEFNIQALLTVTHDPP